MQHWARVQIRSRLGDLDGVLTFCELAVPLVSRVAEHLGLPGTAPPHAVRGEVLLGSTPPHHRYNQPSLKLASCISCARQ